MIDYTLNSALSIYTISGLNAGNIDTYSFSSVESLKAGSNNDTFKLTGNAASIASKITGGGGTDTLDYTGTRTSGVSVDLTAGTASGTGGILKVGTSATIENVIGTSLHDVIFGSDLANTLNGGDGGNDILVGKAGIDDLQAANGAA